MIVRVLLVIFLASFLYLAVRYCVWLEAGN